MRFLKCGCRPRFVYVNRYRDISDEVSHIRDFRGNILRRGVISAGNSRTVACNWRLNKFSTRLCQETFHPLQETNFFLFPFSGRKVNFDFEYLAYSIFFMRHHR